VALDIFINGIYEKGTSDLLAARLPRNGVLLDLGANIGAVCIPVAAKRKDISIVAVEAAPWLFGYLQKNLEKNGLGSAKTVNLALFDKDDEEVNFYSPDKKFGKGSLSPVFTDKAVRVRTIRVDTLVKQLNIKKVDIIKVDVEGYEQHVFKGAEVLLTGPDAPDILFEFEHWAESAAGLKCGSAQDYLRQKGYRIYRVAGRGSMEELNETLTTGSVLLYASKSTRDPEK
jgi:FkbM family methyltransferase